MKKNFIPTIDISKCIIKEFNPDNQKIFRKIKKACIEVGFFQITGHGINKKLINRITKIAHNFFNSKLF